jgi:carboxyl-terminal processing protease
MKADIEGYYFGVGVTIEERKGRVIIINVFPGSPAEQAGLTAGDIISSVDGENILTAGSLRAAELIRGPENTAVKIGVLREGYDEEIVYTVKRANIKYPSVWESKMLDEDVGYVFITQFSKETPEDLRKAIEELKSEGARALILDLRNNGGGPLDAAVYVSDLFIPEGAIVYLQDKEGNLHPDPVERPMTKRGEAAGMPLVVMINQYSASASEIVAGAIQDYKAGEVMGQKSFGKGVVQNVIRLSDGSSLVLTTNKYLTPNKRDINEVGIEPDIPLSLDPKDIQDEYIVNSLDEIKSMEDELKAKSEELREYLKGHDFQLDIAKKYLDEKLAAG